MKHELLKSIELPNGAYLEVMLFTENEYGDPFLNVRTAAKPADEEVGYEGNVEAFNLYVAEDGTVTRKPEGE